MKQTRHEAAIEHLKIAIFSERNSQCREAINNLDYHFIKANDVQVLKDNYFKLMDITLRNKILGVLMLNEIGLKQFFWRHIKKNDTWI
ncbi:hypothetical protein ACFPES_19990 [Paenibacillus sp. GCM10023248]|uniref:hypothetical protein n=1 Tax=unclassified Paenibacillus TaxID=185978 RepID=UPI002379D43C|nr:hypothetical protein [Paenibacillus sp. MAHUQ-63]MDD9269334.1 hypothetical protein [Paenibacillus sp. MAHUQ-63]